MASLASPDQPKSSIWLQAGQAKPVASPATRLWAWLKSHTDAAAYRPCAAPGVVARRLHEDGVTYYVLKNPATGIYLKLSESDYALWQWMDGSRTVKDLVVAYFQEFKTLAFGRVTSLVDELKATGFLIDKPTNIYQQAEAQLERRDWTYRWRQLAGLFIQHEFALNGVDAWMTRLYRAGGWALFAPVMQVVFVVLALAGLAGFIVVLTEQRYTILVTGGSYILGLALLWLANFGVIFIHEHAHALTTKHFGREVRRGGFLIYYGALAFFVDTMDIWMEPKRRRIAVTWAGPYSGLIVGGLCSLIAMLLPVGLAGQLAFKIAFVCYAGVLVNLNPLLELDGYFILIDWLGIPNLRERSLVFIRAELWPKLNKIFTSVTTLPGPQPESPPVFNREETIFTAFGLLAAVYTVYTLVVALYFWQTRFWVLLVELWHQPEWGFKLAAAALGALVIVPLTLVVVGMAWSAGRGVYAYLQNQHFFESARNIYAMLGGSLLLVITIPAFVQKLAWTLYASFVPVLLLGLAVWMLIRAARQHVGSRFQYTLWALMFSAALLTIGAALRGTQSFLPNSYSLLPIVFEQLASLPLLVAAFQSLLEVDMRRSTLWERLAVILILAWGFVGVIPAVQWTAGRSALVMILAGAGVWFTLIFLAAIIPTLVTYSGTRFYVPWLTLVVAAALNGMLCLVRLAPAWPLRTDADMWLGLLSASLWAMGGVAYVAAGLLLRPKMAHWSEDLLLSDGERLRVGFARFYETLFDAFRSTHGARRAKAVDDDLDVISVAADWDVEIDSGRVHDELDLGRITILEQADRYRDVLGRTIDLMDDWAGALFIQRATQAAYDSLPWPERETLGQYVLAGSPWGGAIAGRFDAVRSERYHLLQQVPLLSACNNRTLALIMAAIKAESVPAGAVLGRQGANVTRFVIVQSGAVEKWVKAGNESKEQVVGTLRRGSSLGSEAFMGGGVYTGTYRSVVATDILYLTLDECENLRRAGVKLASQVGQLLAIRQLLVQMPMFASLGPQQLDGLTHKLGRQEFKPGEVIIRQGEERHHFYIIANGQVEVVVSTPEGERVVAQLGPGQHFGETALYSDVPYAATCRAAALTSALTLDEATFDRLVGSSMQLTHYVEQVSSGRVIDTRRKLKSAEAQ
jgi:putative peptide zinc metalloprotease protein